MGQPLTLKAWTESINKLAESETICPLLTRPGVAGHFKPEHCRCDIPDAIRQKYEQDHGPCANTQTGQCFPMIHSKSEIYAFRVDEQARAKRRDAINYQAALRR